MTRRPIAAALAVALTALAAGLAVLLVPEGGSAFLATGSSASSRVTFDARPANALVLQTPVYRLTLAKRDGALVALDDRRTGARLVKGSNGCQWGAISPADPSYIGGCAFTPSGPARFTYAWAAAAATLTLTYEPDPTAAQPVRAVVTLSAQQSFFDLRLTLVNRSQGVLSLVSFPVDLYGDASRAEAGYAPNFLPGVRLGPGFFKRVGNNVLTYPSRWAFADYLGLDEAGTHLAMYSVNPAPAPLAPVDLGFVHNAAPVPCSQNAVCIVHSFQTWIASGDTWTSPVVRIRIGEPVEQTIVDYRKDNGIDAYPSASAKLGARLAALAQAPMIKAGLDKGLPAFRDWGNTLAKLPSPALIHPVAFGPGGFDATDPDVLPPDEQFGTTEDLRKAVAAAHANGQLVMPYLNISWWSPQSPTVQGLESPLSPAAISVQSNDGTPLRQQFNGHDGFIVSPSVSFVRSRVADEIDRWHTEVPVDCVFFDQIGARPWVRDFNPASSTPLAYDDGWLSLLAPYADRCLMVEDGWDRLAEAFSGFDGSLMLMQREFDRLDEQWGAANWDTFPLALWLFHDKVLLYQHDLYEQTMTSDPQMLTWNLAYGFMLSYNWDAQTGTLDSPWLGIVSAFQRALGPHYAGIALTGYEDLAPGVTRTDFGSYSIVANWTSSPYELNGQRIAPGGFLARTSDGSVVAAELAGSAPEYVIVEGGKTTFSAAVPG